LGEFELPGFALRFSDFEKPKPWMRRFWASTTSWY
jgi:hypothetical protein